MLMLLTSYMKKIPGQLGGPVEPFVFFFNCLFRFYFSGLSLYAVAFYVS